MTSASLQDNPRLARAERVFDVVVAGNGPAGGQAARELAAAGLSVALVTRETTIGVPVTSTAGTISETLDEFEIPRDVVQRDVNGLRLFGPSETLSIWYDEPSAHVLDFRRLKEFLFRDAVAQGAVPFVGTTAREPIVEGDRVVGVRCRSREGGRGMPFPSQSAALQLPMTWQRLSVR